MNKTPKPVSLAPVTSLSGTDAPKAASAPETVSQGMTAPISVPPVAKIHQPLQADVQQPVQKSLNLSDAKSSSPAVSSVPEPKASAPAMSADKTIAPAYPADSTVSKAPVNVVVTSATSVTPAIPPVAAKPASVIQTAPAAAKAPVPTAKPEQTKPVAKAAPKTASKTVTKTAAKTAAKVKAAPFRPVMVPDPVLAPAKVLAPAPAKVTAMSVARAVPPAKARSAPKGKSAPDIKVVKTTVAAPKVAAPKLDISAAPALPAMAALFDIRSFVPAVETSSLMPPAFNNDIVKTMTGQMLNAAHAFGDIQATLLDHAVTELKTVMGEIEACARSTTPSEVVVIQARAVRRSTEALTNTLKTISDKTRKTLMPR